MTTPTAKKGSARPKRTRATERPGLIAPEWNVRRAAGLKVLESPALAKLHWLVHGFSTRPGGESEFPPERASRGAAEGLLNLGLADWHGCDRVVGNRERFSRAIGADEMRLLMLRQIHSDIACGVTTENPMTGEAPRADALFTREPSVLLVVQTADCVPILLADVRQHAVAAIHSGWRGTLKRIVQKTLGRMQMEFGTRPEDVVAALGPAIGQSCYEVGADVAREFHAKFRNAREWFDGPFDTLASGENDPNWLPWLTMRPPGHAPPPPRVQLDLIAANRAILAEVGVRPSNISASGLCTACRSDLFFSYRREPTTERMMAAIGIR
jgi:YfiH family protein